MVMGCIIDDVLGECKFWAAGTAHAVCLYILIPCEDSAQTKVSVETQGDRDIREDYVADWILKV